MKNITIKSFVAIVFSIALLGHLGCKEKDFPVPIASSFAKFSYQIDTLTLGEEVVGFEVNFMNQSINAESYLWDFGDGETSTDENPSHTYNEQGVYNVTLTVTSANELHYNKLVSTAKLSLIVKLVVLYEPFNGPPDQVDDTWLPTDWLAIDADGDSFNWYWGVRQGNGGMRSQSYSGDAGALTPDNWLISKEIDLTQTELDDEVWLTYNVCPTANTLIYREEHYGVFVAISSTDPADFEHVFSETLDQNMTNWVYVPREMMLDNKFKGEKIRVAFRHYQVTDMDRIEIDDVEVYIKK